MPTRPLKVTEQTDFLKVVSTNFVYLGGEEIPSHQYSVTKYERNLKEGNAPGRDEHGRESIQAPVSEREGVESSR